MAYFIILMFFIIIPVLFCCFKKYRKCLLSVKTDSSPNIYLKVRTLTTQEFKQKFKEFGFDFNTEPDAQECISQQHIMNSTKSNKKHFDDYVKDVQKELADSQKNRFSKGPMIPLHVLYEDKDIVKRLGALWCKEKHTWFWPIKKDRALINEWLPAIYQGAGTPSPYIAPLLVPQNLWGINLRSLLPKKTWDQLRKITYKQYAHRCAICGSQGKKWPVECDEVWDYKYSADHDSGRVFFKELTALCQGCHKIKHFGKACVDGLEQATLARMCYMNDWDLPYAEYVVNSAFQEWEKKSKIKWFIDFSALKKQYNIDLESDWSSNLSTKK